MFYPETKEELPTNKEYYIELNKKLKKYGLPELIVTDEYVFKDKLHEYLGIGFKLES